MTLDGRGSFKCLADSGASRTAVDISMARAANLKVTPVVPAERIAVASSDVAVHLVGKATIRLEIITGGNGTISIQKTPIWVIKETMNEVLLGEDD